MFKNIKYLPSSKLERFVRVCNPINSAYKLADKALTLAGTPTP